MGNEESWNEPYTDKSIEEAGTIAAKLRILNEKSFYLGEQVADARLTVEAKTKEMHAAYRTHSQVQAAIKSLLAEHDSSSEHAQVISESPPP